MSKQTDRLRRIRLVILDVDGTQTDGFVYYGLPQGPLKRFYVRDGQGVTDLQQAGVIVAFVSGDVSEATTLRAQRLRVEEVHQGVNDKAAVVDDLLERHGIAPNEAAYMGDEPGDLPAMNRVGFAAAPADAVDVVKRAADWVSTRPGGGGAVRELADAILEAKRPHHEAT
ncbi:MAG: KdsC family phosphatase [Candidatus Zipacnadales bacterium]